MLDFFEPAQKSITVNKVPQRERFYSFVTNILVERNFYYYIISCMILMPLGELVTQFYGHHFVTQPIFLEIYGIIGFAMGLGWLLLHKDDTKICISTFFFWSLIFFAMISLLFSKDIVNSTTGFMYDEWPTHFFAYFSLMFLASLIERYEYRRNILYTYLGLALVESVICFMQSLGIWMMEAQFDAKAHAASNLTFGLTQHQNFYAGLSVMFVGACFGSFLFCRNRKMNIILGCLLAFTFYGSLRTSARIAWVGNATTVIFFLIAIQIVQSKAKEKFGYPKIWKKYVAGVLIMLMVVGMTLVTWDKLQSEVKQTVSEFEDENIDRVGNNRFYIWRFGLESVPDNWMTGVGLDNYSWAFFSNSRFVKGKMFYQDKGHNEYIHTLVTQGIPALINYLALLVFASITAVKNIVKMEDKKQQIITWIFFGMFTGYAAQACFNSSVINTAMYFWITIGMIMPQNSQRCINLNQKKKS